MGKTALAFELLSEVVSNPANASWCEGVFFSSMKTEKLTANGIVKLSAVETLDDLKYELGQILADSFGFSFISFEDSALQLKEKKILLFLDNLETLLRDDLEAFETLNESLPRNWQVLITSRITVPHKVMALSELSEPSSVELAKRYITSRDILSISYTDLKAICAKCFHNPLAIRLTLDLIIKGGEVPNSISIAQRDISEFSFSNLIDYLDENELRVLECIFVEHISTRQSIHSLLNTGFDEIAASVSYLSKTSLIDRNINGDKENYCLTSSVRELLLRTPKDLSLRSEINERHIAIINKEKEIDRSQKNSNSKPHNVTHITTGASKDLKVLATNIFKELRVKSNQIDIILGRTRTNAEVLSKFYKSLMDAQSAFEDFALYHRCMAIVLSQLRDNKAAKISLEQAIMVDGDDVASYLLLGRLLMNNGDTPSAHNVYKTLFDKFPPESIGDETYAVLLYNGYYLSLLYQGKYDSILKSTKDWKDAKLGGTNLGLIRASAHKRIAEDLVSTDYDKYLDRVISAAGILNQLFKDDGYSRAICDNALKLIAEISFGIVKCKEPSNKKVDTILSFCEDCIPKIASSLRENAKVELNNYTSRLIDFHYAANPFKDRSWSIYINQSDPGLIDLCEANELGLLTCTVDKLVKPKGILFSFDRDKLRYFSSVHAYQGHNKDDWYNLKPGDDIAIIPNFNCSGELPVARALYIVKA